ncbi:MAG: glycosyltransferase [Planctomycetota bacterium]
MKPSVAIVHDWLTGMRGGERCLEIVAELLPDAPILTLLHEPGSVSPSIERHDVQTTWISKWPLLRRHYRQLLPFYPLAVKGLRSESYDLLLSLSHCAAKAVRRGPRARHVCYCFTPARYLWDQAEVYLDPRRSSWARRFVAHRLIPRLRAWDVATASGVDRFIAISRFVAARIASCYGRRAEVVYPPVELQRFAIAPRHEIGDHYLMVTALAPYKQVDLAIEAFAASGRKLVVVGGGEDERRLRALRRDGVEMRGRLTDREVAHELARARAFVLACEEDFGIAALESLASGRPVLALGRGGALETIVAPGGAAPPTGIFFAAPEPESLIDGIERMDQLVDDFDPTALRAHAAQFDVPIFRASMARIIAEELAGREAQVAP